MKYCECDIALTLDEHLVLCHDVNFKRLALFDDGQSSREIGELTYRELIALPLKSGECHSMYFLILSSCVTTPHYLYFLVFLYFAFLRFFFFSHQTSYNQPIPSNFPTIKLSYHQTSLPNFSNKLPIPNFPTKLPTIKLPYQNFSTKLPILVPNFIHQSRFFFP